MMEGQNVTTFNQESYKCIILETNCISILFSLILMNKRQNHNLIPVLSSAGLSKLFTWVYFINLLLIRV